MNDEIAKWILNGRFPRDLNEPERRAYGVFAYRNNKPVDDTDAVVLLPILVDRGYPPMLVFETNLKRWVCNIYVEGRIMNYYEATISGAILAAMAELVESI